MDFLWKIPAKIAFLQVGKQGKVVPTLHFACWGAPQSPEQFLRNWLRTVPALFMQITPFGESNFFFPSTL
jgi:hypothetical protein